MDDNWIRWILSGLGAVVMLGFGDMFRRLFATQEMLLRDKASKEETDTRFEELIGELRQQRADFRDHESEDRDMHKDVLAEIRETNRHLSMTNATLSNLVGRFDATNGHR